ncbi:MAG TPA: heparan-alpha-glucosaminide N-acetyltransferase domain-containing protein [Puia sp.]|nr:heparan-alpha-glucosaminide N-acetyltransferase domain-containing protein [Puia sp.]
MNQNSKRLRSIDLLRGAIMVLMAIDHVRVYAGIPAGGPDPATFFTRWVTHFCVSGFVFFAGAAAFLYGRKLGDRAALSRYLVLRGLWLVVLELTLIRLCWSFNIHLTAFMLAGVIWMLGWCMVLMGAIIWLPLRVIWVSGLVMIAAQRVFGLAPSGWTWWNVIYPVSEEAPGGINVLYVIVPWVGVMMAGYGFGALLQLDGARRDRIVRWIGLGAMAVFLVAGSIVALSHPGGEQGGRGGQPFLYRLLGQQKYPPSPLFLLMTLGPLIALVPYAEKARGWLADVLTTFGRVPLFYYIVHILVIHSAALLVNFIRTGESLQGHYVTAPYCGLPEGQRWHLPLLYLVFFVVEVLLYFVCRWYERYKRLHPANPWLKYL